MSTSDVSIVAVDASREVGGEHATGAALSLGTIRVVSQVTGYRRIDVMTGDVLGIEDLDFPPSELVTRGFWLTIPDATIDQVTTEESLPGALHAAEHAAIGLLPLFTICDRWDVGGLSTPLLADTGMATIVIHDGYPGGAGIADLGYAAAEELLTSTAELIRSCPCSNGCPSCVQSPKCGNGNDPLDKVAALSLLDAIL